MASQVWGVGAMSPASDPRFRQLRPILGKKIEALEAAWLTGSPTERQEIEIVLELLRRQASDRWSTLLDPPEGNQADGPIRLGRIRHGRHMLGHLGLHPSELLQHTVVLGRSGGGKSNLVHHILIQLKRMDTSWVVTDHKRSTRRLCGSDDGSGIVVAALGRDFGATLSFNPLVPPPSVGFNTHVRQVVQLFCDLYTGGAAAASVLVETIEGLRVGDRIPTLVEVQGQIQRHPGRGRSAPWRQTALRILDRLTSGPLGRVLCARRDAGAVEAMLGGHTILELDGLSRIDASLLAQLLLGRLHAHLLADSPRNRLRLLVCLEEAQELASRRDGARETIIESVIRTGRESGLGMLLATQQPTTISPVILANCFARVCLNLSSRSDSAEAAQLLMLDQSGAAMLGTLPVGQAVCRLAGRWPRPVHLEIPLVPIDNGPFTDREVLARFLTSKLARSSDSARFTGSTPSGPLQPPQTAIPPSPLPQSATRSPGTPTSSSVCTDLTLISTPLDGYELLDHDPLARALLEDVARHPFDGVAARYERLGASRRRGTAAQRALIGAGYLRRCRLSVPESSLLLLELTDEARAWCQRHRVPITPFHGGLEHAYWCDRVAKTLKSESWMVDQEHRIHNRRVDVWAEKDGKTLAVEVESGARSIEECVVRLEDLPADRRVLLWLGQAVHSISRNGRVNVLFPRELPRVCWDGIGVVDSGVGRPGDSHHAQQHS